MPDEFAPKSIGACMVNLNQLIGRVQKIEHGFVDIRNASDEIVIRNGTEESFHIAEKLYASEIHQARCLSTFIFGQLASKSGRSLSFLKEHVSLDGDWRVQEILAKAFDRYCADTGYERALPVIKEWLADPVPNVRRAVTEGLRIWTGRPYFREHPDIAIQLLSQLKADGSEYVRKSVGNAIKDISKKHNILVKQELQGWDISNREIKQTYRLASKFL